MSVGQAYLDDLFRIVSSIDFHGRTLYLRALSDFDLNAREHAALLAAAKKRRDMATAGTPDHLIYLEWLETAPLENLVNVIVSVSITDALRDSLNEIEPQLLPFPDNATTEERQEILNRRQDELVRVGEARRVYVDKRITTLKESLEGKTREELLSRARWAQLEWQTRYESQRASDSELISRVYFVDKDLSTPFASLAQAAQMDPRIRQELISAYYREMERVSVLDLKYFLSTGASTDSSPF